MSDAESQKEIDRICKLAQSSPSMFQVLDLDYHTATVKLVKTQYNKLSLLIHPDKCKLPRAAEAFSLVNRAFTLLKNEIMLKRAAEGDAKKATTAAFGAAAAAASAEERERQEAEQVAREKAKLHEEYLAALRAKEAREKIREREATDAAEKEQEKSDIAAAAEAWKKFKPGAAAGLGMKKF